MPSSTAWSPRTLRLAALQDLPGPKDRRGQKVSRAPPGQRVNRAPPGRKGRSACPGPRELLDLWVQSVLKVPLGLKVRSGRPAFKACPACPEPWDPLVRRDLPERLEKLVLRVQPALRVRQDQQAP